MVPLPLLASLVLLPPAQADAGRVEVGAYLEAEELAPGEPLAFFVDALLEEGWSASRAGMPALVLQLRVPDCVELEGPYRRTYDELLASEFVQEPFERLLEELPARVGFELTAAPAAGDAIEMNVIGYVTPASGAPFFLRRRLSLSLEPYGEARPVDAGESAWGEDERLLQLGDRVEPFELPRPDGTRFSLASWLGERNVIVVTYRAHW